MELMNAPPIYSTWKTTPALALGVLSLTMALSAQEAPRVPSQKDESSAVGSLRSINTAEAYYAQQYGKGFSPTLAALRVPPQGTKVSPGATGLLDNSLTGGRKENFVFSYKAGPRETDGNISTYTVTARPVKWQKGVKSLFTDQTALIHWTDQNRPARASDPAIQ